MLVRTYAQAPAQWDGQLTAYAPATIERLADLGVQLVGIDTASIDPADSKTLDSHQVIRRRGLRVLENLGAGRCARGRLRTDRPATQADHGRRIPRAGGTSLAAWLSIASTHLLSVFGL